MAPRPHGAWPTGEAELCLQVIERHRPLVSPDLHVEVDDIRIRRYKVAECVVHRERALLPPGGVVPYDSHTLRNPCQTECVRRAGTPDVRRGTRSVGRAPLGYRHIQDRFPYAERDLSVSAAEVSGERVGDVFGDSNLAVAPHIDLDTPTGTAFRPFRHIPGAHGRPS